MKRSLASASNVNHDEDDFRVDLSGYHTSDVSDDEGWDLGPPPCRASDVSDDEGWDLGPPVAQKSKKVVVDDGDARGHLVTVTRDRKPRQVYVSYAHADGTLRGGCHNCCPNHQFVDLMAFAPLAGAHVTAAKHTRFVAAYDAYKRAFANGDQQECATQRATLEALRTVCCSACRNDPGYLGPSALACKEWYDAKRREMCTLNNGCANPECPERGPDVWPILTADHGTNPKARHPKTNKPISLGTPSAWPSRGGVPAMEVELKQIEAWPCHVCHVLAPTSSSGRRCPHPADLPKGKKGKTSTALERAQYGARLKAGIKYPKQRYVDAAKRTIGCCAACKRPVLPGTEPGFEFDHRDESTKSKGGLFGKNGGVAGLVHNCAKAAALALVRGLLDAEMDKCQLLCSNCHMRKTYGYPASRAVF